ncbi:MAG: hypothetical protein AB202_01930 [Parcubacteria bacterium C7867-007]|nr:MAG: hypothetical protein AB202_01930 [Parcubacteria bacterium C7867-007]
MEKRNDRLFFAVIGISYTLVVLLSFLRIYVFEAYPIYTDMENMPSLTTELFNVPNFLHP